MVKIKRSFYAEGSFCLFMAGVIMWQKNQNLRRHSRQGCI
ncbi:hypothetical protein ANACAC_02878 [Anaerostipes caccae L1-92]|uniref:Uncharacterized protein n=1 Tax=Anaerostipes caccae (strain DSM 14662 / CCUG 47493 / JCM 13470 / NCIMB 13811 / L1-92) TaxID=411490 RepID=B0MHB6_ANACD|nr:hypothetical protein ANACAC_02878 [Anaerostipes caccae L1-92]